MSRTSKGRAIQNLIELRDGETVQTFLSVSNFETREDFLFFVTREGRVKRTALQEFRNVNKSGIIALKLNDNDHLVNVLLTSGTNDVLLATAQGLAIRFDENDARVMGRATAGVTGMNLRDDDYIVGAVRCDPNMDLLTATVNGFGKRTALTEYMVQQEDGSMRCQSRGGKGRYDIKTEGRNGLVVSVRAVTEADQLMLLSKEGMVVRIPATAISQIGRNTMGVRIMRLGEGDALMGVALVAEVDETTPPSDIPPMDAPPEMLPETPPAAE